MVYIYGIYVPYMDPVGCTAWFLGILIMADYNPHIAGVA